MLRFDPGTKSSPFAEASDCNVRALKKARESGASAGAGWVEIRAPRRPAGDFTEAASGRVMARAEIEPSFVFRRE